MPVRSPDQVRRVQWDRLSAGLDRTFARNAFYRRKYEAAGVARADVASLDDLHRLPPTVKAELAADQAAHPPFGCNLGCDPAEFTRFHQTSGTSGQRLRWLDTPAGWDWICACWRQILTAVGVTPTDRLFFPFSFGPFLGFWGAFDGGSRFGCLCVAGGGMTTVARLATIEANALTVVLCTPTYGLRMIEVAAAEGIDLAAGSVRKLILAGEPGANIPATREKLEAGFGAEVFDHSGMTEIAALSTEFAGHPGKLFVLEEDFACEVVDPDDLSPVPEGEVGELLVTNLGRWDSPLVRYRTGDLVRWRRPKDGVPAPWLYFEGGILGRADDMLFIKGNNVYPSAVEAVVRTFPEIAEFSLHAVETAGNTELTIRVEPLPDADAGAGDLAGRLTAAVRDRLLFRPDVQVVAEGALPRFEMKARRLHRE